MEAVLSAVITGVLALAGTVITTLVTNGKTQKEVSSSKVAMETKLETSIAVVETKVEELTREVRAHNNFASRMPVVEEQVKVINHRIADLEKFHSPHGRED